MSKTYKKFTGLLFATTFITVMFFGLNMGMDMHQDGTMSGCAFDQSVTCPMNYKEHINHWQQIFTATQSIQNTILGLLIVITLGGITLLFHSLLNWRRCARKTHHIPQAIHRQREITAKLADHILQALSNGRLNPRLYNFSKTTR